MNLEAKARVLNKLSLWHVGQHYGITVKVLAEAIGVSEREIRFIVTALREDGLAICAHPTTGYFVAANDAELADCIQFLKDRALHSLRLAAKLTKQALPDLVGQLKLES